MTEPYLTTVLEEAEHVAKQHDQVALTTDNQAHEYLRYSVRGQLVVGSDQYGGSRATIPVWRRRPRTDMNSTATRCSQVFGGRATIEAVHN